MLVDSTRSAQVAADEVKAGVAGERAGQQAGLAEDLEAVADAEHRHAAVRGRDDLVHDRGPGRRWLRRAGSRRRRSRPGRPRRRRRAVPVGVPQVDGLAAGETDGANRVDVVESAGEGDDADSHGAVLTSRCRPPLPPLSRPHARRHPPVLDHGVGQQAAGDPVQCVVVDGVVDLQLEVLALPHVGRARPPRGGAGHPRRPGPGGRGSRGLGHRVHHNSRPRRPAYEVMEEGGHGGHPLRTLVRAAQHRCGPAADRPGQLLGRLRRADGHRRRAGRTPAPGPSRPRTSARPAAGEPAGAAGRRQRDGGATQEP